MKRVALLLSLLFASLLSSAAQWPVANAQFPTGPYYSTGATGTFPLCTTDSTGIDCVNKTASFYAPLKTSLTPAWSAGSGTPTFTRATTATVYGYAEAAVSGASQTLLTIPAGIPRFSGARFIASNNTWSANFADGIPIPDATLKGYLSEGAATNYFLNSGAPVTQTISLGTGTYTTWLTGTGSITTSAGTATATGYGVATAGTPNTITVTMAGTVVFTVAGTVTIAQVENNIAPSSYIATAGTAVIRNADLLSYASVGNLATLNPYSIYFEASINGEASSTGGGWGVAIGSNQNYQPMFRLSTGAGTVNVDALSDSGVAAATIALSLALRQIKTKYVLSSSPTTISIFAAGVKGTDAIKGAQAPEINRIYVGAHNNTYQLNGNIREVRIFPTHLTDTTSQALTQ